MCAGRRVSIVVPESARAQALLCPMRMAIAERLSRYKDFATFLAKYGRADFVTSADADQRSSAGDDTDAGEFVRDIESLGPTFIKLGQLLSSRAELLPPAYTAALARLQDAVAPFPFAE